MKNHLVGMVCFVVGVVYSPFILSPGHHSPWSLAMWPFLPVAIVLVVDWAEKENTDDKD